MKTLKTKRHMIESLAGLDPDAMLSAFVSHGLRTLRRMSTSKLAALFNKTTRAAPKT